MFKIVFPSIWFLIIISVSCITQFPLDAYSDTVNCTFTIVRYPFPCKDPNDKCCSTSDDGIWSTVKVCSGAKLCKCNPKTGNCELQGSTCLSCPSPDHKLGQCGIECRNTCPPGIPIASPCTNSTCNCPKEHFTYIQCKPVICGESTFPPPESKF